MGKQTEKDFFNHSYDGQTRASVGQVYSLIHGRNKEYEALLYGGVVGKKVLEYGCGTGSHSLEIARRGGEVVGIDISEIGINNAREKAAHKNIKCAEYLVMDAENMSFEDDSFDLVIGEGILHHLDLEKSYREISRVLKPGGQAVFMEPLGHNPAINLFRKMTPRLRTPDEHPLVKGDLKLANSYFGDIEFRYFHLTSFAAMLFLKTPFFFPAVRFFDKVDSFLFRAFPPSGLLSWYTIMILGQPLKSLAEKDR